MRPLTKWSVRTDDVPSCENQKEGHGRLLPGTCVPCPYSWQMLDVHPCCRISCALLPALLLPLLLSAKKKRKSARIAKNQIRNCKSKREVSEVPNCAMASSNATSRADACSTGDLLGHGVMLIIVALISGLLTVASFHAHGKTRRLATGWPVRLAATQLFWPLVPRRALPRICSVQLRRHSPCKR